MERINVKKKFIPIIICIMGILFIPSCTNNNKLKEDNIEYENEDITMQDKEPDNTKVTEELIDGTNFNISITNADTSDLVYREFACGVELEKGSFARINSDYIKEEGIDNSKIIIILNGELFDEAFVKNGMFEYELRKSGNYIFYLVGENGERIDIMQQMSVYSPSTDGVTKLQ